MNITTILCASCLAYNSYKTAAPDKVYLLVDSRARLGQVRHISWGEGVGDGGLDNCICGVVQGGGGG